METFLLKYYSVFLFFQCMMGVIGVVTLVACLFWLWREFFTTWREKKTKQKEGCQQQEKRIWLPEPPVLLSPKERREYMLNHIEDGRFYAISSLCRSDVTIVCAQRYDAEEQRLYCYAYLFISGRGIIICISSPLSARPSFATSLAKNDCVLTSISFLAALSLKKRTFLRILMIETTMSSRRACKRLGTAGRLRRAKITDWALTNIS